MLYATIERKKVYVAKVELSANFVGKRHLHSENIPFNTDPTATVYQEFATRQELINSVVEWLSTYHSCPGMEIEVDGDMIRATGKCYESVPQCDLILNSWVQIKERCVRADA